MMEHAYRKEREEGQTVEAERWSLARRERRYLSVKEAARVLEVSQRSVYGYIENGKLAGKQIEGMLMVKEEDARCFVRKGPGRVRTRAPKWRKALAANVRLLTIWNVARDAPVSRQHAEMVRAGLYRLTGVRYRGGMALHQEQARPLIGEERRYGRNG